MTGPTTESFLRHQFTLRSICATYISGGFSWGSGREISKSKESSASGSSITVTMRYRARTFLRSATSRRVQSRSSSDVSFFAISHQTYASRWIRSRDFVDDSAQRHYASSYRIFSTGDCAAGVRPGPRRRRPGAASDGGEIWGRGAGDGPLQEEDAGWHPVRWARSGPWRRGRGVTAGGGRAISTAPGLISALLSRAGGGKEGRPWGAGGGLWPRSPPVAAPLNPPPGVIRNQTGSTANRRLLCAMPAVLARSHGGRERKRARTPSAGPQRDLLLPDLYRDPQVRAIATVTSMNFSRCGTCPVGRRTRRGSIVVV